MIQEQRMTEHLMDIIRIDSPSRREKDVAVRLEEEMKDLGAECFYDDAGEKVGADTGNMIVRIPGTKENAPPFFLCSHMDTVSPGEGIKPRVQDGVMRSDGTTILGSDDKSGVSIIVEVLRTLRENDIPHSDIEVAFTICEEVGLLGAKFLDTSSFKSTYGIVLDSSTPDRLVLRCPCSDIMDVKIYGVEAHSGLCPENGISAVEILSEAISRMKLGRIDHETTANIGKVNGGSAINIVPGLVEVKAEARSHDPKKLDAQIQHMCECFLEAAGSRELFLDGERLFARAEVETERVYPVMNVSPQAVVTKLVLKAAENIHHDIELHTSGGGCDANYINEKGIECVNLGTGMYELHTVNEYLLIDEFRRSAEIVLETIKLHSESN
ncbi:MAG: M20/M25/M40 family metallo-hydrolase [Candidatus Dadabacteria bacterium]|nr:M20/M25/M40 family metallo-hydrolase [Candidatus Dadabacteria bacterium]MDE0663699.1 M20/M25/M40 family metallo-hydrolase [Candidatus Dadabacteria bacterium]